MKRLIMKFLTKKTYIFFHHQNIQKNPLCVCKESVHFIVLIQNRGKINHVNEKETKLDQGLKSQIKCFFLLIYRNNYYLPSNRK